MWLFRQYLCTSGTSLLQIWPLLGAALLVNSVQMKTGQNVGSRCDRQHISLVHDITDTSCQTENGSCHGHVFMMSKWGFCNWKTAVCYFYLIPINRVFNDPSFGVPLKRVLRKVPLNAKNVIMNMYLNFIVFGRRKNLWNSWQLAFWKKKKNQKTQRVKKKKRKKKEWLFS